MGARGQSDVAKFAQVAPDRLAGDVESIRQRLNLHVSLNTQRFQNFLLATAQFHTLSKAQFLTLV
ncbi:hypothetical protein GCM10017056_11290 [Seohaeicola zhoushanensis]|uniref:Uncharacterized protein n=1 Tax=Seohaeicola zhoushanensis TaxID=1569283 RepID=A0A8J3GW03_9RHOB|nr:hypothetical protein GCM10017056_11290 [Seohaeicola zhoushanensis]